MNKIIIIVNDLRLKTQILCIVILMLCLFCWLGNYPITEENFTYHKVKFESNNLLLSGKLYIPENPGKVDAVVLSHGFNLLGKEHFLYREMSIRLAEKGYVVLAFDYRGFNQSPKPSGVKTETDFDFAYDLSNAITFLENQNLLINSIILVGHSFGAGVAMNVGLKDKRVNKI